MFKIELTDLGPTLIRIQIFCNHITSYGASKFLKAKTELQYTASSDIATIEDLLDEILDEIGDDRLDKKIIKTTIITFDGNDRENINEELNNIREQLCDEEKRVDQFRMMFPILYKIWDFISQDGVING